MSQHLAPITSWLPTAALLLWVGIGGLVAWHLATDRRHAHRRRMESLALDQDDTHA